MNIDDIKLVKWNDPILYKETENFDFNNQNPQEMFDILKYSVNRFHGLGFSANQVGIPFSVFVIKMDTDNIFPFFNPKFVFKSEETDEMEEGCISFPGLNAKIKASKNIRLRFQTVQGETTTYQYSNMTARIVQHEMKHLNGRPFFDGLSKLKIERMVKKCLSHKSIKYNARDLWNL